MLPLVTGPRPPSTTHLSQNPNTSRTLLSMLLSLVPLASPAVRGMKEMGTSLMLAPRQCDLSSSYGLAKELSASVLMAWMRAVR